MSYPTVAQVTAGVVFGAANEFTGTGADAAALVAAQAATDAATQAAAVAAQLATDVAAVNAGKADIKTTRTILTVQGTFNVTTDHAAVAAAQKATDQAKLPFPLQPRL